MTDNSVEFFKGLRALAKSAFPKKCANCGREFGTAKQYLSETFHISEGQTGLKESQNDDGSTIVEAFRNCPCGSTLLDFFNDRRDTSGDSTIQRQYFGELIEYLVRQGMERNVARSELIKVMRGEKSELLNI